MTTDLSALRTKAAKELKKQDEEAAKVAGAVSSRQNNLTRGKLVGRIFGSVFLMLMVLGGVTMVADGDLGYVLQMDYGNLLYPIAIVVGLIFGMVMMLRDISLMGQFGNTFRAAQQIKGLRDNMQSHNTNLAAMEKKFLGAKSKGYDLELDLPAPTPEKIQNVGKQVTTTADNRLDGINKFLVVLFYIGMVALGAVAATACFGLAQDVIYWAFDLIGGLLDLDLVDYSAIGAAVAVVIGFVAQFWPATWYVKSQDGELTWWAPVVFAVASLCAMLGAVAVCLLAAALGLVIGLVAVALAIGFVVLGIWLVSLFCCGG